MVNQAADDDRGEAADVGEREVQLAGDQRETEAEPEDRRGS